jgi:hypothetical protein
MNAELQEPVGEFARNARRGGHADRRADRRSAQTLAPDASRGFAGARVAGFVSSVWVYADGDRVST